MEAVLAIAIGVLAASGVWLLLRPRTFQVIMGLALLSYAVNLFIFGMGRLTIDQEPVLLPGMPATLGAYDDPMPQALVLTAIVIGFAMTALFLVVLMAARGLAGTDHVDGDSEDREMPPPAPPEALDDETTDDEARDEEEADAAVASEVSEGPEGRATGNGGQP